MLADLSSAKSKAPKESSAMSGRVKFADTADSFACLAISFFSLPALISRLHIEPRHRTALLGPRLITGLQMAVRRRAPAVVLVGFESVVERDRESQGGVTPRRDPVVELEPVP